MVECNNSQTHSPNVIKLGLHCTNLLFSQFVLVVIFYIILDISFCCMCFSDAFSIVVLCATMGFWNGFTFLAIAFNNCF